MTADETLKQTVQQLRSEKALRAEFEAEDAHLRKEIENALLWIGKDNDLAVTILKEALEYP